MQIEDKQQDDNVLKRDNRRAIVCPVTCSVSSDPEGGGTGSQQNILHEEQ